MDTIIDDTETDIKAALTATKTNIDSMLMTS